MTADADSLIERLAELAGLAPAYWDGLGQYHEPSIADRRALLLGLGYDVSDALRLGGEIERIEAHRLLAPWLHFPSTGATTRVAIRVAAHGPLDWRLLMENGTRRTGDLPPGDHEIVFDLPDGLHRLVAGTETAAIIVAPRHCYLPRCLEDGGRVWGMAIQLYTLRSGRNWGIGDYTDLSAFAVHAARAGADLVGINPLHARSLFKPEDCSPYSPVSRHCLDTLSIDVEAVPELGIADAARSLIASAPFRARLAGLRAAPLVDYAGVAAVKLEALRLIHAAFCGHGSTERRQRYRQFVAAGGEALGRYATFEAIRAVFARNGAVPPWRDWPEPLRDLDPAALADPEILAEADFQLFLQFIADEQLDAAAAAARAAGMRIGLYRDEAVAAAADSAEGWAIPAFASGVEIGAPPDPLALDGQNWGLPAPDPRALEQAGFGPYLSLLEANMRGTGALRLDHVMALQRLFITPRGRSGANGTYLAYPFDALTSLLVLSSNRARCLVIGEDLGAVPEGFRPQMAARAILSYKVLTFERREDGSLKAPQEWPFLSLGTAATHDLPTIAGFWLGRDIAIRSESGLLARERVDAALADRMMERRRLIDLFEREGVVPTPPLDPGRPGPDCDAVVDAVHRLIARAGSAVAIVQIDDVLGETDPVNLPGTWRDYPNWRRKLRLDLDDAEFQERFERVAAQFRAERPRPQRC